MKSIVFLDIDGVLLPDPWRTFLKDIWHDSKGQIKSKDIYGYMFFEPNVLAFNRIVESTNCDIVISSSWRTRRDLSTFRRMWAERDIEGKIIGLTPILSDSYENRGDEIQMYLDEFNPSRYCIIDDKEQMNPDQAPFFVRTNHKCGLTQADADKCIDILNAE